MGEALSGLRDSIFGHQEIFQVWEHRLATQSLEGTFVFVGPQGVGKVKTALALIQQTLCQARQPTACGHCGSCLRVAKGEHESLFHIKPAGNLIKVDQAHEVLQFCQLQSLTAKRFVIIEEADKLGPAAANVLLKTLEEPPTGTVFLLTAPSTTALLPTIRSRAQVLRFQPLSLETLRLAQAGPEWALQASQGRMDRLQTLLETSQQELRKSGAHLLLQILTHPDLLSEETWRENLKAKEDLRRYLELWLGLLRDVFYLNQGETESLLNPDLKTELGRLQTLSDQKLQKAFHDILELQKQMVFNKDAVLSLESLYIQMR